MTSRKTLGLEKFLTFRMVSDFEYKRLVDLGLLEVSDVSGGPEISKISEIFALWLLEGCGLWSEDFGFLRKGEELSNFHIADDLVIREQTANQLFAGRN